MSTKYELITELYRRTVDYVTNPEQWQKFLRTAGYNFRLDFDEQILLYAQKPEATAVLEIEKWNKAFGRWVNKGSTGIAFFDKEYTGSAKLKYLFDISDTHEGGYARQVPIWNVLPEYEESIIETLENNFGELEDRSSFGFALLSAAKNAVSDNMEDYFEQLECYKENSFLEDLDELNIKVIFREALRNSVGYMMLSRCGVDTSSFFTDDDFRCVRNFSTVETLNVLGTATGDISRMCLDAISKTVLNLQRQAEKENRTFDMTLSYNGTNNEYRMTLKGTLSHTTVLGADIFGNITRTDNLIDGMTQKLEAEKLALYETKTQLENARAEMETPFAKETELKEKSERLKELNILLNMDQQDRSLLDEGPEEQIQEKEKGGIWKDEI